MTDFRAVSAIVLTIKQQEQDFATWQQTSRKLPKDLRDIFDTIKTHGNDLDKALTALGAAYSELDRRQLRPNGLIAKLETKLKMVLLDEVKGASNVYFAIRKTGNELDSAIDRGRRSVFDWGKVWQTPEKAAAGSLRNHSNQLRHHMLLIRSMARELRQESAPQAQDIMSDIFFKDYDALGREQLKQVSKELYPTFEANPFAVTVSEDHGGVIYNYLDQKDGYKLFLQHFENMGSKWAAQVLDDSPTKMQTLERAHTKLSCGVMNALKQSVSSNEGVSPLRDDTDYLRTRLERWEELTSHQKIIIAIGGHFSHGKSSFLNALLGDDVLPTNKAFTTAIPCRIQHKAGAELTLEIPCLGPYQDLLTRVKGYAESHKINGIPDGSMVKEAEDFVERCEKAKFLVDQTVADTPATKLVFREPEIVREQLYLINTLVRLCSFLRDSKPLKLDSPLVWPVITYDIAILSIGNVTANVQFLDLPGFNDEVVSVNGPTDPVFFSMMKHAAEEATFIIPVVAFGTVNPPKKLAKKSAENKSARGFSEMWIEWEKTLYQKKWRDRIPAVVVTKAMQEERNYDAHNAIKSSIAQVWGGKSKRDRVLFCDSLIGLGAMQLEKDFCKYTEDQETTEWRPEYSTTLVARIQDPRSPMRHLQRLCEPGMEDFRRGHWSDFLGKAKKSAGIRDFNVFLASKICDQTPHRRLQAFHLIFPAGFKKLISMHKQAIEELRMPLEEFRRITTQAFADTQNVKKRLEKEGWEILTVDATAGRTQPTRTFQDEFERSVRGEWEVVKKELEQLLLGAGSQHRVSVFPNRAEYRRCVDPNINKLAKSFAVIQATHVDRILDIASKGVQEVINTIDDIIRKTITDTSWKEIVRSNLAEFRDIPHVFVYRLKGMIKGTTADSNYTAATLLESLHKWASLTDEPFDRLFDLVPPTESVTNRNSIMSPITPTPPPPVLSQPSETGSIASTLVEPSTNDPSNLDELRYTTKELASGELEDSGFLISVPSPDEWLDTLPTDNAILTQEIDQTDGRTSDVEVDVEVKVDIDELLTMTEKHFVEPYISAIMDRTFATSEGWIKKTVEACQQRLEQLMVDRESNLDRRLQERTGATAKDVQVARVVSHMMAIGNLVAANTTIDRLSKAIKEWECQLEQEEANMHVIGINSPRAVTPVQQSLIHPAE